MSYEIRIVGHDPDFRRAASEARDLAGVLVEALKQHGHVVTTAEFKSEADGNSELGGPPFSGREQDILRCMTRSDKKQS